MGQCIAPCYDGLDALLYRHRQNVTAVLRRFLFWERCIMTKPFRIQRPQNNICEFKITNNFFFSFCLPKTSPPFFSPEVNLENAVSSRPILAPWTEPYQRGERSAAQGHWAKLRAFVRARMAFRMLLQELRIREAKRRFFWGVWMEMFKMLGFKGGVCFFCSKERR